MKIPVKIVKEIKHPKNLTIHRMFGWPVWCCDVAFRDKFDIRIIQVKNKGIVGRLVGIPISKDYIITHYGLNTKG